MKESPQLNLSSNLKDTTTQNDDDFGDFVGPDSTQMDGSNNKTSPVFLNDQLWVDSTSNKQVPGVLADNRSVSSLELPGVTLSRHGSLPSLDLNLFPTSDDSGDKTTISQVSQIFLYIFFNLLKMQNNFLPWLEKIVLVHVVTCLILLMQCFYLFLQLTDWIRCLERACSLLQSAASTFTNITSHSVLLEVLSTAEGKNYLSSMSSFSITLFLVKKM